MQHYERKKHMFYTFLRSICPLSSKIPTTFSYSQDHGPKFLALQMYFLGFVIVNVYVYVCTRLCGACLQGGGI